MDDASNDVSPRDDNASKYFCCFAIKANGRTLLSFGSNGGM